MATDTTMIIAEHEGVSLSPPEGTMDFDYDTLKGEETITNLSRLLWNLALVGIAAC